MWSADVSENLRSRTLWVRADAKQMGLAPDLDRNGLSQIMTRRRARCLLVRAYLSRRGLNLASCAPIGRLRSWGLRWVCYVQGCNLKPRPYSTNLRMAGKVLGNGQNALSCRGQAEEVAGAREGGQLQPTRARCHEQSVLHRTQKIAVIPRIRNGRPGHRNLKQDMPEGPGLRALHISAPWPRIPPATTPLKPYPRGAHFCARYARSVALRSLSPLLTVLAFVSDFPVSNSLVLLSLYLWRAARFQEALLCFKSPREGCAQHRLPDPR